MFVHHNCELDFIYYYYYLFIIIIPSLALQDRDQINHYFSSIKKKSYI